MTVQTEAELKRRDALGALAAWVLVDDPASATGVADPVVDAGVRARLDLLAAALQGTLDVATDVESGLAKDAQLEQVRALLAGTLTVDGPAGAGLARDASVAQLRDLVDDASGSTVLAKLSDIHQALNSLSLEADQISIAADAINLNTDTVEALLAVVRDRLVDLVNRQIATTGDLAPLLTEATFAGVDFATQATAQAIADELAGRAAGNSDDPVHTTPAVAAQIAAGRFRVVSSSRSVPSGSEATWSVANPAGSGVVVHLLHVSAANDATAQVRFEVWRDSTIAGGDVRTPWDPNFATGGASAASVVDGAGIRSGGTRLDAVVAVTRDAPFAFDGLLVIPPGTSLQLTGVVPGALSSQQLTVGARWYEVPV